MAKPELIARTGRVQNWIDNPESRLPVSCTIFNVEDSMEGPNGLEASWRFVSHALRHGAGCAVHLSKLRPRGDENGRGLTASGPVSFAKIYSTLNEILRRGGHYKNGAVVIHMDYWHDDALEFVNTSRAELPWVKKCLDVDSNFFDTTTPEFRAAVLDGIRKGDLWLNKIKKDQHGERIYGNVCLEVYLKSRGTCLLQHVNLGACNVEDLGPAFVQGMGELIKLHGSTGVDASGEYLSPTVDRQVGLGMLGLANFLANYNVSYAAFGEALSAWRSGQQFPNTPAGILAKELHFAIEQAAQVARQAGMDRAFCIAPTASCSYNYKDNRGYTTTPEIAPPISRHVDRDSGTFGVQSYDYPPNCEIASEVGWAAYKEVADGIVALLNHTGLFHGYSFNSWSDVVTYDEDFLKDWFKSPQTSLYYSLQVMPDTQAKDDALAALDEDFRDLFNFEEEEAEEEETTASCSLDGFCSSCAE